MSVGEPWGSAKGSTSVGSAVSGCDGVGGSAVEIEDGEDEDCPQ